MILMVTTPADAAKNTMKEKTSMSHAEFLDMIHENFVDEVNSANKYLDYYDFAKEHGKEYEAEVLIRVANDEESHARYLLKILGGNDYKISPTEMSMYDEMEERFH